MQRNVDRQLFGFGIEVPWSEVTSFEITLFAWNIQLDMIVGGWGREVVEVVGTKDYSQHPRRDMPLFQDGECSASRIAPYTVGSVFHISLSVWIKL